MRGKRKLLVVDDETPNLEKLKRTFVTDFEVYEAKDGKEALTLLKDVPFSAIITDQRMPGISGVDLLRESLQLNPNAIRIILTGFTEVEDLIDSINEGHVDRYVTKPWDPFSLKHAVRQELERAELKKENELLAEQLRIAKEVQRQLFPQTLPLMKDLDYTGVCVPANGVGGDYYDFLKLQDGQLCIALGDVSGKGISAALLMASLQALFRSHAPLRADALDQLVAHINQLMCSSTDDSKFATFFCGVYDDQDHVLTYVNAGHNPPLWFRRQQSIANLGAGSSPTAISKETDPPVNSWETVRLETGGVVLGLFPEADYSYERIEMQPGDILLVFTDGVTEAFDVNDEEFGERRLEEVVRKNTDLSATQLTDSILEEISGFIGDVPKQDDLTIVVVKLMNRRREECQ